MILQAAPDYLQSPQASAHTGYLKTQKNPDQESITHAYCPSYLSQITHLFITYYFP